VLHERGDLTALASRVRGASRSWVHTMTDPGGGIAAAENLFATEPVPADRRVIDVSGDGDRTPASWERRRQGMRQFRMRSP
jgi:hypothetical protein